MDREIPKEKVRRSKLKRYVMILLIAIAIGLVGWLLVVMFTNSIVEKELKFATITRGNVDIAVDGSGKVIPSSEIIISAPFSTKILELYAHEGDVVEAGQSLMKLDLESQETEMRVLSDERTMKTYSTRQTELASKTYLTNLEMQIKTKEMQVRSLKAEYANERRLDSIGSGTGDRVREAELAFRTAELELAQLRTQLSNERKSHYAEYLSKQVEERISERTIAEKQRILQDAQLRVPHKGTLTWLNQSIGGVISQGEKLAVLSNLARFKIEGMIGEADADKLTPGAEVVTKIGNARQTGRVAMISPQAKNGVVAFTVILDNDSARNLKSGIRVSLTIPYDRSVNVVRIPAGSYYTGPGMYLMFVKEGRELKRREVILGGGNMEFIEVKSGLNPGETVCISNMKSQEDRKTIKLK